MGDSRRFDLFAKVVANNFPPEKFSRVADVAGGAGYLGIALKERGYGKVILFDKRKKHVRAKGIDFRYQYFGPSVKDPFDILVGMHPDEATDVIIVEAARRKIPFAVCPCCVKPTAKPYFGQHTYKLWVEHLKRLAIQLEFKLMETTLPMNGKNIVLVGRP